MASNTCLRWMIIIFNTFSIVFGILGLIWNVLELQKYSYRTPDFTEHAIQIGIGALLVISAFVGCCGSVQGSTKVLVTFIIMLMALMAAHGWMLWRYNETRVKTSAENIVVYKWIEELVHQGSMNDMHAKYECCGKHGYVDYNKLSLSVPESCFHITNKKKSFYPHGQGCLTAVSKAYLAIYRFERWSHIFLIGFELFGITLSIYLACHLSAENLRYTY